jgi:hypothetical protein
MAKFSEGDLVRIIRSVEDPSWFPAMDRYNGSITKISKVFYNSFYNFCTYRTEIDRSIYCWEECSLHHYIINEKQVCSVCCKFCPHSEPNLPNNKYICTTCSTFKMLEG